MKRPTKRKKAKSKQPVTTEVYVDYKEIGSGREDRSTGDGKWDFEWSEERDIDVRDVWLNREMASTWCVETMSCEGKVEPGDVLYLIVVRYSSGDTFGHGTGYYHFEKITKSAEEAVALRKSIEEGTHKGYKPWDGYFESLERVEMHKLVAG